MSGPALLPLRSSLDSVQRRLRPVKEVFWRDVDFDERPAIVPRNLVRSLYVLLLPSRAGLALGAPAGRCVALRGLLIEPPPYRYGKRR